MSKSATILEAKNLEKYFIDGSERLEVFRGLNFSLRAGERVAIIGPSGSGKSTLLYLLGGLDAPNSGSVHINGRNIITMSESTRATWRNLHIAYVLQQHHLLREFNTLENVALPLLIRGESRHLSMTKARNLLESIGLGDRLHHFPEQLSGGQAQRAAIAQALVGAPKCVLMDEPTGNLDEESTNIIKDLLIDLSVKHQVAILLATHNMDLANAMQTRLLLRSGQLVPKK